jgi:predicted PurR-regulated permease PerM
MATQQTTKENMQNGGIVHLDVDITVKTFIIALLIVAGVLVLFKIKIVFLLIFISYIMMSVFRPFVYKLVEGRISKPWAILIVYGVVIALITGLLAVVSVPVLTEISRFIQHLPELIDDLASRSDFWEKVINSLGLNDVSQGLSRAAADSFSVNTVQQAVEGVFGVFGLFISTVSVIVMSAYLVAERDNILKEVTSYIPKSSTRKSIRRLLVTLEHQLGLWFRGLIFHVVIVFVMTYVSLTVIGVPFALSLAVIAGMLEIVPTIGPFIAFLPAFIIAAATGSPLTMLGVVATYIIISILEGNIITPQVMKRVVGLNPLVTLIAILIGAELAGIPGVVIAVPSVVVIQVILKFMVNQEKNELAGQEK